MFHTNQIVRGKHAGVFVILAFRSVGETAGVQLKELNPANLVETAPGELFLPMDCIKVYE